MPRSRRLRGMRRGPAIALSGLIALTLLASDADAATMVGSVDDASVVVEPAETDAVGATASRIVAAMSTRDRAASIVMGHIPTTDPATLSAYMASSGIGGFILMGANVPDSEQELRQVTDALTLDRSLPPVLAIDQEGGDVSRLPWDVFASSLQLKTMTLDAAGAAFAGRGALVQRAGIGVNFGIVADFTADPGSFIARRSLGVTATDSSARVSAAAAGEQGFAASTLKHFPGHGAAPGDSHVGIPSTGMSYDQWRGAEALPFEAGIAAGAPLLMYGHLAYTSVDAAPASLSGEWHRIAREDLGFEGVAITDDLGMLQASGVPQYQDPAANAVAAVAAGNDMVLTVVLSTADTAPRMVEAVAAAVEGGTLAAERLEEAATRVMTLRMGIAARGSVAVPCPECAPAG